MGRGQGRGGSFLELLPLWRASNWKMSISRNGRQRSAREISHCWLEWCWKQSSSIFFYFSQYMHAIGASKRSSGHSCNIIYTSNFTLFLCWLFYPTLNTSPKSYYFLSCMKQLNSFKHLIHANFLLCTKQLINLCH